MSLLKRLWRFLVRMDVVCVLVAVVLALAALGSCFPQGAPGVEADAEGAARWEAEVRARYAGWTDALVALGVFRFFLSPLFLIPLSLLAVSTLVCLLDRWRSVWRQAFQVRVRCPDSVFEQSAHTASLRAAGTALPALRESLERRGFRVRLEEDEETIHLRADRFRLARLGTLATHLGVLLLLLGAVLSGLSAWREQVTIAAGSPGVVQGASGIVLHYQAFSIERYADGSAKGYQALIRVTDAGKGALQGAVRVNQPLAYAGLGIYLQEFAHTDAGEVLTLLVVHEPGYAPVVLAGFLLLLGMTVSFNFPHCCVFARLEADGGLRLAGRADRNAHDFPGEFADLVSELDVERGEGV